MGVMCRDLFSPVRVFFLIVFGIESIVSLLGNGLILAASGLSWIHSKKTLPCDFLLTTLSLSRFLLQCVFMSFQSLYISSPEAYITSKEKEALVLSWIYLNIASLLCATWLNVFYCVKVTNFAHPLFFWLKLRIGVLVPRCLGISLLAFIICSIHPVMSNFEDEKGHNFTGNLSENSCQSEAQYTDPALFLQIIFTALSLSICLMASVVLLLSLWRHKRNLKKGGLNTKDFSTQAHLSVMTSLLLSLFFYILYFVAMTLLFGHVLKQDELERLVSDIFLTSYPSAHSVILIFTNSKLRKVCARVLNLRRSAS